MKKPIFDPDFSGPFFQSKTSYNGRDFLSMKKCTSPLLAVNEINESFTKSEQRTSHKSDSQHPYVMDPVALAADRWRLLVRAAKA